MCTHKSEYTHPPGRLPPQYMNFIPPTHTWQLQWMYCLLHWLYNVYTCYKCDYTHPPLASKKRFHFHPLSTVLDCVLITLHTPKSLHPPQYLSLIFIPPPHTHIHLATSVYLLLPDCTMCTHVTNVITLTHHWLQRRGFTCTKYPQYLILKITHHTPNN